MKLIKQAIKYLNAVHSNIDFLTERCRDHKHVLVRDGLIYYLYIKNYAHAKHQLMELYDEIGEIVQRSPNNVLERICAFRDDFDKNIEELGFDFWDQDYKVGDKVQIKEAEWYRSEMPSAICNPRDIKVFVKYDGSVFYRASIGSDLDNKIEMTAGTTITISNLRTNKGFVEKVQSIEYGKEFEYSAAEIKSPRTH